MGTTMKRVQEAIVEGKVDSRWEIKRHDPGSKEFAPKGPDGKQAWPKDQYGLAATFKNASGAPLLSFDVAVKGAERRLGFASFATTIEKHRKFSGPPDRRVQGQEIEAFLNELEKQYGQALTDAVAHLK